MNWNNKGGVAGFVIMIVLLFVALLGFVIVMPIGMPFIDMIATSDADPLTKFLFMGIPVFLLIALIVGVVLK